jgi:hypothetical protein
VSLADGITKSMLTSMIFTLIVEKGKSAEIEISESDIL